jgi:[ribosomal protein S5]-alanine N-acetyltransferase
MDDYRGHRGNEATDQWPGLPPELLCRNWRTMPPVLKGPGVALREVETGDAATLLALLSRDEIAQVIAPPPQSASELQTRIEAARLERSDGRGICFSVVPERRSEPVGLFRVRELEHGFGSAEWEFVLAPEYWGGGLFFAAAPAVVDFAFDALGVHRLEARAAVHNGRGNGALRKIGAVQEGVLRRSLQQEHGWVDQTLWTLIAEDWHHRMGRRGVH